MDALSIIKDVCQEMNGNGFVSSPRVVLQSEFDLSKFKKQESDVNGCDFEYVNQSGPGMFGDDFSECYVLSVI